MMSKQQKRPARGLLSAPFRYSKNPAEWLNGMARYRFMEQASCFWEVNDGEGVLLV